MKKIKLLILLLSLIYLGCKAPQPALNEVIEDGKISFNFMQINDVYEISPLSNGTVGGMARVATLTKNLKKENPNTLAVLAGDFLSPSLMGSLKMNGERIRGKQMVEAMNSAQIDLVTFGNHEFDLKYEDLQKRMDESDFEWISSNVLQRGEDGSLNRFYRIYHENQHFLPDTYVWEIEDKDGTKAKIGLFGLTLSTFEIPYVHYEDFYLEAVKAYQHLSTSCDLIIGVTHLEIDQDLKLAKLLPNVPLIMGGHDHQNMHHEVGRVQITKADANAKTAYVHRFTLDKRTEQYQLKSELVHVDESIDFDPVTTELVKKWEKILLSKVGDIVDNPTEIIFNTKEPLDGLEISIRNKQTNLGKIITASMYEAATKPVVGAIFNSGGIRIDDQLSGAISTIDIFRVLPYGGALYEVELNGKLLIDVLEYGDIQKGKGAYLQRHNFSKKNNKWMSGNEELKSTQHYRVIMNDFLLLGFDVPFLKEGVKGIIKVEKPVKGDKMDIRTDVRKAVVQYLKKQ